MVSLLLGIQAWERGHIFQVVSRYFSGGVRRHLDLTLASHAESRSLGFVTRSQRLRTCSIKRTTGTN